MDYALHNPAINSPRCDGWGVVFAKAWRYKKVQLICVRLSSKDYSFRQQYFFGGFGDFIILGGS